MSKILSLLALLVKPLTWLLKLGGLTKYLALIPGGQVFAVIGTGLSWLLTAVVGFIKWLLADIADAFKEPQRLAVRVVCLLAVLGVGVWQGIEWDAHNVKVARQQAAQWKSAHAKLLEDAKSASAADKARFEAAIREKQAAEKGVTNAQPAAAAVAPAAAVAGPPAPAAPAKRVRPAGKPAASKDSSKQESLRGFFNL